MAEQDEIGVVGEMDQRALTRAAYMDPLLGEGRIQDRIGPSSSERLSDWEYSSQRA
jgi:hypothetical protein